MVSKHGNAPDGFSPNMYVGAEMTSKSGLVNVSFALHSCCVKWCTGDVIMSALSLEQSVSDLEHP